MKIEWKDRLNKNSNDCWCDVIAYATGRYYDEVRNELSPFIKENGMVTNNIVLGVLQTYGYDYIDYENYGALTVEDAIALHNSHDCELVFDLKYYEDDGSSTSHIFYVNNNTIYDFKQPEMLKQNVCKVIFRKKE